MATLNKEKYCSLVKVTGCHFNAFPESPDTTQAYQPLGPVLVAFTKSSFLQQLVAWVDPTRVPIDIRSFLLRLVFLHLDLLVSQAKQDVLNCPEVLRPILQLLVYTKNLKEVEFSQELSLLLKSLCVLLCRDPFVLKNSEKVSLEYTHEKYFIFSQLVPLLHLQSPAGDNVRDAFLLILALSVRDQDVAQYLTSGSDLCPVLATGLSGLYSSLPRNLIVNTEGPRGDMSLSKELYVPGAGWHRLSKQEWSSCQPLSQFLNTLDFCDLAVRKSGVPVRKHILFYIYSGFLLPVLGSALNQLECVVAPVEDVTNLSLTEALPTRPSREVSSKFEDESTVKMTTLKNGLRVVSQNKFGMHCTVGVMVSAGPRFEMNHVNGTSHFIEKLGFHSTDAYKDRDAVQAELENCSAIFDCQIARDFVVYAISGIGKHLKTLVHVLSETILRPRITDKEVEMAAKAVGFELATLEMSPPVEPILNELLHSAAYGGNNTLGLARYCPKENISSITRNGIMEFMASLYK
nr:unnamed protein product [Spirometra erinaceieuropaei]